MDEKKGKKSNINIDRDEYAKARKLWVETQDAAATLAIFPKRGMSERKLLQFYLRSPGQHAKAIKSVCFFFEIDRVDDLNLFVH